MSFLNEIFDNDIKISKDLGKFIDKPFIEWINDYNEMAKLYKKEIRIIPEPPTIDLKSRYIHFTIEYKVEKVKSTKYGIFQKETDIISSLTYKMYYRSKELSKFSLDTKDIPLDKTRYIVGIFIRYMFLPDKYNDLGNAQKVFSDLKEVDFSLLYVVPVYKIEFENIIWDLVWPLYGESNNSSHDKVLFNFMDEDELLYWFIVMLDNYNPGVSKNVYEYLFGGIITNRYKHIDSYDKTSKSKSLSAVTSFRLNVMLNTVDKTDISLEDLNTYISYYNMNVKDLYLSIKEYSGKNKKKLKNITEILNELYSGKVNPDNFSKYRVFLFLNKYDEQNIKEMESLATKLPTDAEKELAKRMIQLYRK